MKIVFPDTYKSNTTVLLRITLIVTAIVTIFILSGNTEAAEKDFPFYPGEKLTFQLKWTFVIILHLKILIILVIFVSVHRFTVQGCLFPRPVAETSSPTKLPTTTLLFILTGICRLSAVTHTWILAFLLFSNTPPTCFISGSIR